VRLNKGSQQEKVNQTRHGVPVLMVSLLNVGKCRKEGKKETGILNGRLSQKKALRATFKSTKEKRDNEPSSQRPLIYRSMIKQGKEKEKKIMEKSGKK